ncbi:MAG: hypothetical protein GXP08_15810 [Gammaproteobacteria bacterium]|nr:hypothetical protein [Gammaproteobacteria bacterium]
MMMNKPLFKKTMTKKQAFINSTLYPTLTIGIIMFAVFFVSSAMAIGKIIAQSDVVEADRISITLDDKKLTGIAQITGCEKCPLKLKINKKTRFFYQGKQVPRKKIWHLSDTSGTVIYDDELNQTIKIHW